MTKLPKILVYGGGGQDGLLLKDIYAEQSQSDRIISIYKDKHKESIDNVYDLVKNHSIDSIIYLAGFNKNTFEENVKNDDSFIDYMQSNAIDYQKMLFFLQRLPTHIVYASTCRIFKKSQTFVSEDDEKRPESYYSLAKYTGAIISSNHDMHRPICVLNFFNHVSEYSKPSILFQRILHSIRNSDLFEKFKQQDLDFYLDIGYAKEFMLDLIEICKFKVSGEFNVSTGSKTHVGKIVNKFIDEDYFSYSTDSEEKLGHFGKNDKIKSRIDSNIMKTGVDLLEILDVGI